MARFDTESDPTEEQRTYNAQALATAIRRGRDAALNQVTTQGSPAEWLAQKVAPDFKSTNQAGIYADEPDLGGLAVGMHTVYHGTPATWPAEPGAPLGQFRRAFKNTGEGGAYKGAGAYVAEAPATGESYREGLTRREVRFRGEPLPKAVSTPESAAQQYMQIRLSEGMAPGEAIPDALAHVEKMAQHGSSRAGWWQDIAANLRQMKPEEWEAGQGGGSLYRLDYPDELLPRTLDFDAPLAKQTPEVLGALDSAGILTRTTDGRRAIAGTERPDLPPRDWRTMSGEDLYHALVKRNGGRDDAAASEAASRTLAEAGIPAHRFLDQGSRGTGEGSRNFVVYEPDKHLKTEARYPSLAAMADAIRKQAKP